VASAAAAAADKMALAGAMFSCSQLQQFVAPFQRLRISQTFSIPAFPNSNRLNGATTSSYCRGGGAIKIAMRAVHFYGPDKAHQPIRPSDHQPICKLSTHCPSSKDPFLGFPTGE